MHLQLLVCQMNRHILRLLTCRHDGHGLALTKGSYGPFIALMAIALVSAAIAGFGGGEGANGFSGRCGGLVFISIACIAAGCGRTVLPGALVISSATDVVTGLGGLFLSAVFSDPLLDLWSSVCMVWQIACVMTLFYRVYRKNV